MRITLDIDDGLLTKAKTLVAKERTSLARLIEQGLTAPEYPSAAI